MAEVLYPSGYGKRMETLAELRRRHEPHMHPEFANRLFPFLEAQGGFMGIGGGYRTTQPVKKGFAKPGRSFHQLQPFPSGNFYAGLDMVVVNAGRKHRAPRWGEVPQQGSAAARLYGVHMNVGEPGSKGNEPWHCQPIELDGWDVWVRNGRPDLKYGYLLDGGQPAPIIVPISTEPPNVGPGDRNATVALLQQKLGIIADGWFGRQTEKAVRAFQRAHGLTVDGWVGRQTWTALGF